VSDPRESRRRTALAATEPVRAVASFGALAAGLPLLRLAPRGDAHPVLVLPGLMAGDLSTGTLRRWLRGLGYPVVGWELGRNRGPTPEVVDGLPALVERLAREHGTAVSIVGQSLGGIFARRLAMRSPHQVRQVITLGSPFRLLLDHRYRTHAAFLYRLAERWHAPPSDSIRASAYSAPLLEVPATAIYSKTDGVASWQWCLEDDGPRAQNIEVYGSHCGLGHNPAALVAIADRLAQPEGEWQPFTPPRALRHLFP